MRCWLERRQLTMHCQKIRTSKLTAAAQTAVQLDTKKKDNWQLADFCEVLCRCQTSCHKTALDTQSKTTCGVLAGTLLTSATYLPGAGCTLQAPVHNRNRASLLFCYLFIFSFLRHLLARCRLHPPGSLIVGVQTSGSSIGTQTVTDDANRAE